MKRRLLLMVFVSVALGKVGRAETTDLHTYECEALSYTATYVLVYNAIQGLKDSGSITSLMSCEDLGDSVGDLQIPTGTFKDCICEALFPASGTPMCSDPHNACTVGVKLDVSSSMMACRSTATDDVAGKVCMTDNFCCTETWDQQCVTETPTAFWSSMDAEVETIVNRMDLTCDQKDQLIANLQVEANADSAQLPCLGSKTYPSNCGDRHYFAFGFHGNCMGVAAGNMTNGTTIVPWSCNANASNGYAQAKDQAWTIDLNDCYTRGSSDETPAPQYCSIRNGLNYNKCLGVKAGSTAFATNFVIWDCLGISHPDQYWSVTLKSDGYHLQNAASAKQKNSDFFAWGVDGGLSSFVLGPSSPSSELPVTP